MTYVREQQAASLVTTAAEKHVRETPATTAGKMSLSPERTPRGPKQSHLSNKQKGGELKCFPPLLSYF